MLRRRAHSESGNATALALLATLLLSGLAAGLASVSFGVNRTGAALDDAILAGYAAEAGLEHVRAAVSFAAEDADLTGNPWLNEYAIPFDAARAEFPGDLDDPVLPDLRVGTNADRQDVWCDVWVYSMDDDGRAYRMVARGWAGAYTLDEDGAKVPFPGRSVSVLMAQDFRARDTFARFATFVDKGTLRFGKTTVAGDVHSNEHIEFHYGGAKFLDRVTAVKDFSFKTGASEAKTSFRDQNRFAPRIELPTVTDVNAFGEFASGVYSVSGENAAAYPSGGEKVDASIELKGDEVRVIAVNQKTNEVISDATHPLPPDGVIYVQGNVRSIQGELSGRLTISTPGKMNVTGDIVYADRFGNRAMRLEQNGEPVDPATLPKDTAWKEEDGFRYVKNPEFTLEGEQRPALGLMAGYEITLDGNGPENLEIHGAMFSATANWKADLKVTKGNLRILGSITTKTPGQRAQGKKGYGASGEYIYDDALLENPPPHWLEVNAPFFGPRWRMGW